MNINLTLFGQTITFAFFVWFCMKYIWPHILSAMTEREQKIADGLQAAERAKSELASAQEDVAKQIQQAKEEAASILEQANKRSRQMVEEAKEAAHAEGERLKHAAAADIEQEINRAKEQLRKEVSQLALTGAQQILEAEIDASRHNDMLDKLAANL